MATNDPKPIPALSQKDIDRFWSYVDKSPGQGPFGTCWLWARGRSARGYGKFAIYRHRVLLHLRANRVAYFIATTDNPDALPVLHSCDNPPCCNPAHLRKDTSKKNSEEMVRKGRVSHGDAHYSRTHPEKLARGERHGSFLHPERVARGPQPYSERRRRGDNHPSRTHPENLKPVRGEECSWAKVTEAMVHEIRAKYATGKYTMKEIAVDYPCSHFAIGRIVRRERWKHI